MQHGNRNTLARVIALALALMLVFSCTASFAAASFGKSNAGVKYDSKKFKLGDSVTASKLKKSFGSYSKATDDGCTCGYATHRYTFKSKGLVIETLQKKKKDKKEKIIGITLTKNKVPTIAGVKVKDSNSTLGKKYGTNCKKNGSKVYYSSGKYYMKVYTKSKKITKIQFFLDL